MATSLSVVASENALAEARACIEAALYAAGRPLAPDELARAGGLSSKRQAVQLARALARSVNGTLRAVQVVELRGKFAMQLRPEYVKVARKFASRPLLPYSAMKTLSYIAYFQPVTSMDLAAKRGAQAYGHLRTLETMGLVKGEPQGRTRVYRTTPHFAEYLGLSPEPDELKRQLERFGLRRPAP
jgi:segregation and condensation protein B